MILKQGLDSRHDWEKIEAGIEEHERNGKALWPYIAGWADGDGTFENNKGYALRITEENPVHYVANIFSSSVYLHTPENRPGHGDPNNPRKTVMVKDKKRFAYLSKKIMPFMIEKRNQIKNIMKKQNIDLSNETYLKFTDDEFIQYLTGFTEAEGGWYIYDKDKYLKTLWNITNTNLPLLHFIKNRLYEMSFTRCSLRIKTKGGKKMFNATSKQVINSKKCYTLSIYGRHCVELTKKMIPYILIPKKKQNAERIVKYYEEKFKDNSH